MGVFGVIFGLKPWKGRCGNPIRVVSGSARTIPPLRSGMPSSSIRYASPRRLRPRPVLEVVCRAERKVPRRLHQGNLGPRGPGARYREDARLPIARATRPLTSWLSGGRTNQACETNPAVPPLAVVAASLARQL